VAISELGDEVDALEQRKSPSPVVLWYPPIREPEIAESLVFRQRRRLKRVEIFVLGEKVLSGERLDLLPERYRHRASDREARQDHAGEDDEKTGDFERDDELQLVQLGLRSRRDGTAFCDLIGWEGRHLCRRRADDEQAPHEERDRANEPNEKVVAV